jgi:hypothetical protein
MCFFIFDKGMSQKQTIGYAISRFLRTFAVKYSVFSRQYLGSKVLERIPVKFEIDFVK